MLLRWIRARRERRNRIEREAADLETFLGAAAYDEARSRARESRKAGDHVGDVLWSRAAVQIAGRAGIVIGQCAHDRYEDAWLPPDPTTRHLRALADAAQAIAAIARGESDATTLHNACARIRQVMDQVGTLAARRAGDEACRAMMALGTAGADSGLALQVGRYPERADEAARALSRLMRIVAGRT
jgi:hypothetical protein